jgi:zinc D-Ala-D-Ala carboxypeptidase
MTQISKYISLVDASKSITAKRFGINNVPDSDSIENMRLLCFTIYDPLCDYFGRPLPVSSFYRNPVLNKKIGGSYSSQHCKGQAMDIDCDLLQSKNITNEVVFFYILNNLHFDQLIWEFGTHKRPDWVHVSYAAGKNRGQVLVSSKDKNKRTVYTTY